MTEFKIAMYTGPQRGEQCKLFWSDVDLDGKRITGVPLGQPSTRLLFPPADEVSFLKKSIRCELRNSSLP